MRRFLNRGLAAGVMIFVLGAPCASKADNPESVEELKTRVAHTNIGDRPQLCLRIAEKQVEAAKKFYSSGESDKAQAALDDVAMYAEMDRDAAIRSHKHEKQSEIAIRKMVRTLDNVKHSVSRDDQERLQATIDRLQQYRDDLLAAMFPGGKK
jgi:Mor family transcriptional regulator